MDTRCVDISVEPTREYVCAGLPAPQGATRSVSTHHSSLRASCLGELARFLSVELFSGSVVWDMCYVRDAGRRKKYRETLSEAQPCAERAFLSFLQSAGPLTSSSLVNLEELSNAFAVGVLASASRLLRSG